MWQLAQGRTGVYNTWHPPIMAWLLGLADWVSPGAPLFVVVDAAIFFGGLFAFAALAPRPRLIVYPLLVLLCASPLVLIHQGVVLKDVLFANAAMAGFAALAWAGRDWAKPTSRYAWLGLAFALLCLASLARQNGFIAAFCGAVTLSAISFARETPAAPRKAAIARSAVHGLAALALVAIVAGAATYALDLHSDGEPENANQLRRLQVYDLAGAASLDPKVDLSILHREDPAAEAFIRDQAAPHYSVLTADNLEPLPGSRVLDDDDGGAIGRQWRSLVLQRPVLYARVRTGVFLPTVLTPTETECPVVTVGVDTNTDPDIVQASGLTPRHNSHDQWDRVYEVHFFGTPVLSHLFYGGLLIILLGMAIRDLIRGDRRPEVIAVVGMGASALLFTASFFVLSSACDYRYLYFLDVVAMAALVRQAAAQSFGAAT